MEGPPYGCKVSAPVSYTHLDVYKRQGVAQLCTKVVVPQVGVGIKVHDVQIRIFLQSSPHGTQRPDVHRPAATGTCRPAGSPLRGLRCPQGRSRWSRSTAPEDVYKRQPLCRAILTAHGGTLTRRDNIPNGSVFSFALPQSEVNIHE